MATQEPNVYAGLAVVIGGLMHARPRFFAKVMGELLFWVGEDKMLFGSDYGDLGAEVADRGLPRLGLSRRRGVLGLPAPQRRRQAQDPRASTPPSCTASRSPTELRLPELRPRTTPAGRSRRTRSWSEPRMTARRRPTAAGAFGRAALARCMTPSSTSRSPRCGSSAACEVTPEGDVEVAAAAADAAVRSEFRVPDGGRRAARGARGARGAGGHASRWRTTTPAMRSTPRSRAATGSPVRSPARRTTTTWRRCASCSRARR